MPFAKPDFTFKRDPCAPTTIQFFTNLTDIENYEWDFGDGHQSTGDPNPVNTYADFGNYVVKLRIRMTGGCLDSLQKLITVDLLPDNLILTNDTTICHGSTKQLQTIPSLSFCWSPVTYLDNPNSPNPTTSATQDITYYFTAEVTGTDLVVNGDFSSGNSGFTSEYNFDNSSSVPGQYFIGTDPGVWHSSASNCDDHTNGNGNMMAVAPDHTPGKSIWKQTVPVTPNTNYVFSVWMQTLTNSDAAQLQLSINGNEVGSLIKTSLPSCNWIQTYINWNSGNNATAELSLRDERIRIMGNFFAVDDISFAPVFMRRDSVVVKVEKPLVMAGADTTICIGTSAQLNATGAQTYIWSPIPGLSAPDISNPVASPIVSTEYIVTGTSINGCSAKDTVNVNIFTKPTIVVSDDTLICRNAQAQLSATGGASYSWSPAATLNNSLIPNPIASPLNNTMYYVDVKDANTCSYLDSVEVAIRPDAVFTVTDPSPVCRLDSAQLNASGGDIYTWQLADGLSSTNISNPKAAPAVTTDYTVTITESTCNQSATLLTRVTVMPLPDVNAVKSSDIDCRNDRSQLTASGADQYIWIPAASLNNAAIHNPLATPASATQYIVTGRDLNGCSAKDTVDVNVFSKPTIAIANDTTICKGAQAQLNVTGGTSYSWSPASTLSDPLVSNPLASPVANTKYYVVIRDAINCEYLDSVEVSVRPDAIFSVNGPGQICKDGSLQLSAAGGDIYSWFPATGLNNAGIANPMASPSTTTDYTVTITESICNQAQSLTTRLTIMPSPAINAAKSNDIDCSNDRSQLIATGAVQYLWTPATTLNDPAVSNPVATPLATTEYIVEGIDALGCKGYDTITVKVDNINKGGYLMPSAFTPNNDGLNDCYGIKYWGVIQELEFSIYNRWGERIFFTKNAGQCWDGTYKGAKQNGGVYVYMVRARTTCENEVFRKGTFVLVR